MSSGTISAATATATATPTGYRSDGAADRCMRRLLGVMGVDKASGRGAHSAFRTSVVISGIRCLVTYLLIPIVVPVLSLAGWVAAPVGMALCAVAVVNGVVSVRRFWRADHPSRWVYTLFVAVVFAILTLALMSDLSRLGVVV